MKLVYNNSLHASLLPCVVFGWALFSSAVQCGAEPKAHRAYRIDVTVVDVAQEASVICSPTVITRNREQAAIHVEKEMPVEIEGTIVKVHAGTRIQLTPYRLKAGGVKLDMELEFAKENREMGADKVIEKLGLRRIQQVPLGVPVDVPVTQNGTTTHRVRIKVSEVDLPLRDVPPAPRAAEVPKPQIRR